MWARDPVETLLVLLIALHSMGVGLALLIAPEWSVRLGGWGDADPLFFPRQGGAFHVVLACAYLIEYLRYRGVVVLVTAKILAFVFLAGATLGGEAAWAVPLSALTDGLMGAVVFSWRRRGGRASLRAGRTSRSPGRSRT